MPRPSVRSSTQVLQPEYANGIGTEYLLLIGGADRQFCDMRRIGINERIVGAKKHPLGSHSIEREAQCLFVERAGVVVEAFRIFAWQLVDVPPTVGEKPINRCPNVRAPSATRHRLHRLSDQETSQSRTFVGRAQSVRATKCKSIRRRCTIAAPDREFGFRSALFIYLLIR